VAAGNIHKYSSFVSMKKGLVIFSFLLAQLVAFGQPTVVKGEVIDEWGNLLADVKISLPDHQAFYSNTNGEFSFSQANISDSLIFSLAGYKTTKYLPKEGKYAVVKMILLNTPFQNKEAYKILSTNAEQGRPAQINEVGAGETYNKLRQNAFINAQESDGTTVSLNIDKASYSNMRRFILHNSPIPPDVVRKEELINYFPYPEETMVKDSNFQLRTRLTYCPWNKVHQLIHFRLQSPQINYDQFPPSQLVFLVDVSASMEMPNRLPLLKKAFEILVNNLRPTDRVSIITYGARTNIVLPATEGWKKDTILRAMQGLRTGGFTDGESGIRVAYALAQKNFVAGGNNRVIVATDGDFNIGIQTDEELGSLIAQYSASGIFLTCIGVGMGNYKDSKLQMLARRGKGNFAYIDYVKEAEKLFMQEFAETMYNVAENAFLQFKFNPELVKRYKLIGYENAFPPTQTMQASTSGGDIGSGQAINIVFEIEMPDGEHKGTLVDVNLGYQDGKIPETRRKNWKVDEESINGNAFDNYYRLNASLLWLADFINQPQVATFADWQSLMELVNKNVDKNDFHQLEYAELVEKAFVIYAKKYKLKPAKKARRKTEK